MKEKGYPIKIFNKNKIEMLTKKAIELDKFTIDNAQ